MVTRVLRGGGRLACHGCVGQVPEQRIPSIINPTSPARIRSATHSGETGCSHVKSGDMDPAACGTCAGAVAYVPPGGLTLSFLHSLHERHTPSLRLYSEPLPRLRLHESVPELCEPASEPAGLLPALTHPLSGASTDDGTADTLSQCRMRRSYCCWLIISSYRY